MVPFGLQLALLSLVTLTGSHLAGKDARRNAVDPNLESRGCNIGCEHAREVDCCRLGRVIAKVMLRCLHQPRNGSDVDDGR